MRFEYILLLFLSILPIVYKLWYWEEIFKNNKYSLKLFFRYIKTAQWRDKLFHFWTTLEIPLFLISFVVFISAPFEILLFNAFLYLLLLYNVFVIWKILRKTIEYPSKSALIFLVILCMLFDILATFYINSMLIYVAISSVLLFAPLYFIASLFVLQRGSYYR